MSTLKNSLFPKINTAISAVSMDSISSQRKEELQPLIEFIQKKKDRREPVKLNFICTHNSRRSHLSQVWAQTAAHFYSISDVTCYSGGTEATRIFPMIIETLKDTGFEIEQTTEGDNPVHAIQFSTTEDPIHGFSKKYDDSFNPSTDFAAVMTCTEADSECPIVPGAAARISLPFEDPKRFDLSTHQREQYAECSRLIATEMKYVFSQINSH